MESKKAKHSLYVLTEMIKSLPEPIQTAMYTQLTVFIDDIAEENANLCKSVMAEIDDAQVYVTAMQFDLESTKIERDHYRSRLGE